MGKLYAAHSSDKSGAMLAWEYFHPGTEVPRLIQHIDDYDRWQFKIEGTKAFNKALWSRDPWSFEQWSQFLEDTGFSANDGTGIDAWYREGTAILRAHDQNVQSVVKGSARGVRMLIDVSDHSKPDPSDATPASASDGYLRRFDGLAANCPPHLTSDVGHELATQSGTFGLCWCLSKEGMAAKCSLRSNGDYDVSAIAKVFGGGGHLRAAGFEVPIEVLLSWMK